MPDDRQQHAGQEDVGVFKYDPLDRNKNEIRVLELLKGEGTVRCHLHQVSLDAWTLGFKTFHTAFVTANKDGSRSENLVTRVTEQWIATHTRECEKGHTTWESLVVPRCRLQHENTDWRSFKTGLNLSPSLKDPISHVVQPRLRMYTQAELDHMDNDTRTVQDMLQDKFCCAPRYAWGDFEALSYCWGSDKRVCDLTINGALVKIPESLNAALEEIRKLPEIRAGMRIWCDAICINQDDAQERRH